MKIFKHVLRFAIPVAIIYFLLQFLGMKVAWWIVAVAGLVCYALWSAILGFAAFSNIRRVRKTISDQEKKARQEEERKSELAKKEVYTTDASYPDQQYEKYS